MPNYITKHSITYENTEKERGKISLKLNDHMSIWGIWDIEIMYNNLPILLPVYFTIEKPNKILGAKGRNWGMRGWNRQCINRT